jgi:hypothetical protein
VVGQVALAFILVIEIALLARTATRLRDLEKGFDPTNVPTRRVDLPSPKYVEPRRIREFVVDAILVGIERLPGINTGVLVVLDGVAFLATLSPRTTGAAS